MVQVQVEIPDDLYARASAYSRERELPLAEVVRRGLELVLEGESSGPDERGRPATDEWELPTFDGGGILVPIEDLKRYAYE